MFYCFSGLCENRYETSKIKAFVLEPPEPPCPQSCTSGAGRWVPCHSPVTTPSEPPLHAPGTLSWSCCPPATAMPQGGPSTGPSAPGQGGVGSFTLMTRWNGQWSLSLNGNWEDKFFTKKSAKEMFPVDERVQDMKLQKESV